MRRAEEDLHARKQALHLYGKALDSVAGKLPRSLRHLAPGIAQASASAIAHFLGFDNAPETPPATPTDPPGPKTLDSARRSHRPWHVR